MELDATISDCKLAYDRVEKWARTEKAPFSLEFFATNPVIRKEPKGVVLLITPFNYPVWLTLGPMVPILHFSLSETVRHHISDWRSCCRQLLCSQTV